MTLSTNDTQLLLLEEYFVEDVEDIEQLSSELSDELLLLLLLSRLESSNDAGVKPGSVLSVTFSSLDSRNSHSDVGFIL